MLGDEAFAPLGHCQKHIEGARAHVGVLAVDPQQPLGQADLEMAEAQRFVVGRRWHLPHSPDVAELACS